MLNKISVWMVAINPVAKFALGTRPLNTTIEHLLGVGVAYPEASPPPASPRARRQSSSYSNRARLQATAANGATNSSSTLKLRGATARRSSSAALLAPDDDPKSSGTRDGGSAFSRVSAVLAAQKERTKALVRIALRVGMTAGIVAIAIFLPDFDRVMSFLGGAFSVRCLSAGSQTYIAVPTIAFSAFVICVIMPLCAKIRIYGARNLGRIELALDSLLLVISVVMAGIGTVFTFLPTSVQ